MSSWAKMPSASVFTLLSAAAVVAYAIGVHNLIYAPKERSCSMTYMFEYPQFAKIAMLDHVADNFKRYNLYAYSEGHHIDAMRKMKFSGVPVLFIPGSGGSYKQARSLASVCMRKALNSRSPFHLDFFTVDLNEEYSALYGGVLEAQTEFVRQSIYRILDLYKNTKASKPQSVVLVGHSMSGLIAKGIFNDPSFDPSLVQVILTFATPHNRPVIVFDEYTYQYYQATSKTWVLDRGDRLAHVTLASVGGGPMDYLVQTDSISSWDTDLHTVTTTVPTVWRSVDHLAILWCKELVLVTARALFDMVDLETKQISSDQQLRRSIIQYHFLKRNGGKQYRKSIHHPYATFLEGAEWIEPLPRQTSISGNIDNNGNDRLAKPKHIMIRLVDHPHHAILAVEAINHQESDWVFVCQANVIENNSRICKNGENLSNYSQFWPSLNHKRKRVVLDLLSYQQQNKYSHVILRMPLNSEPVQFHIDVHANRVLKPPAMGPWLLYDTRPVVLVEETAPKALRYIVDFAEVESLWHVLNLVVKPVSCLKKEHHAVAMLLVPWSNEKSYSYITEMRQDPLPVRLLHVKPRLPKNVPKSAELKLAVVAEIALDPSCTYKISVEAAPGLLLSQFARSLTPCIFPYMVAILLLTLREQLQSLRRTGHCSLFHLAMSRGAKPFYILPLCKILTRLLNHGDDPNARFFLSNIPGVPEAGVGMNMMARLPLENLLYPFLMYMCAFGLVYVSGFVVMFFIVFNAKVVNGVALSFIGRFFKRSITAWISPANLSEYVMEFMIKAPPIVVALLLILGFKSCGALALILGGVYFYAVLCNMYSDYMEALLMYSMRVVTGKEKISLEGITNPGGSEDNSSKKSSKGGEEAKEQKKIELKVEEKGALAIPSKDDKVDSSKDTKDEEEEPKEEERNSLSDINVYMTVFMLYVASIVPSIPSLLIWAHNYSYDPSLVPDPTFVPFVAILMSVSSTFWIHAYPHPRLPFYRVVVDMLFVLATFTLLYAPNRISFVPYIIAGVMVLLAGHQWLTTLHLFLYPPIYNELMDSENESDADSINDNRIDSSHSATDDEVADGDDEGGESGSNSDEDANDADADERKIFSIGMIPQPHADEADDSSDADDGEEETNFRTLG